jgi:DNA polymerase-4
MTGLSSEGGATKQMTLGEPEHGWREAEQAADRASDRFGGEIGDGVVIPARLLRH